MSRPDEPAEREADRVAAEALRMPAPAKACSLRRAGAMPAISGTASESVYAPATGAPSSAHPLPGLGPGRPLPPGVRDWFEPRLGVSLDGVRVHTGPRAAHVAGSLRAQAFTLGDHIVLGDGHERMDGGAERALLGHELVHVVQNRAAGGAESVRHIRRLPAVTNCDRDEERNIVAAQRTVLRWLDHTLTRVARAAEIAAELSFHFRSNPRDTAGIGFIRTEIEGVRSELASDLIAWNCTPGTDPACANPEGGLYAGYADSLGSHSASFCGNQPAEGGNGLATVLLHEALHAKAPGIPDGPYYDNPDYPGAFPLNNADAYTNFVRALATGILGLARAPRRPPGPPGSLTIEIGDVVLLGPGAESRVWTVDEFAVGSAAIPTHGTAILDEVLDDWQRDFRLTPMTLRVIGHTDGSTASENIALGELRARAVADYLLDRLSRRLIPLPVDVRVTSFGSSRPYRTTRPGSMAEPLNRRVQIELRQHRT
ncbi:MAG: DUF4157 domain-containing protein [Gemmatimonadetes bacterium]|nr:DUF4157 domain-containing protein [Gemmatimonadota bacterium]